MPQCIYFIENFIVTIYLDRAEINMI